MATKPVWTIGQIIDQLNGGESWVGSEIDYSMTSMARTNPAPSHRAQSENIQQMTAYDQATVASGDVVALGMRSLPCPTV